MSGTSDILVLKAARRASVDSKLERPVDKKVAAARLYAFAEVASDVLGICTAPQAFIMAITRGLAVHPIPQSLTRGLEQAQAARAKWESEFLAYVYEEMI